MVSTRETIFAAATALLERGEAISMRTVRQALGGGSPNEIAPGVKEWKTQQAAQRQEVEALADLPPAVRDALTPALEQVLARLWAILRALSATELETLQQDHETQRQALREDAAEQSALVADLAAELDKAQQAVQDERRQRETALEANVTLRAQAAVVQDQLQALRAQLAVSDAARASATLQAHDLEGQVTQLSDRLHAEQTQRQAVEIELHQAQLATQTARTEAVTAAYLSASYIGPVHAHPRQSAMESAMGRD